MKFSHNGFSIQYIEVRERKKEVLDKTAGYTIKIENFEGPLDLLFHLIEKNKMDIYDIKIAEIADQYMEYLNEMEQMDLEIASEFIVMASTLLLIKSRMLLPQAVTSEEDTEDLKDQLINRLVEYKRYKDFTNVMREREEYYGKMFYKSHEIFKDMKHQIKNKEYASEILPIIYTEICRRNREKKNPYSTRVKELIVREKVTIRSKIREIAKYLLNKTRFKFTELFEGKKSSKIDVVTSFMAVLELARVKRVAIEQEKIFGDITIKKVKKNWFKEVPHDGITEDSGSN